MRKRILSILGSLLILCSMVTVSVLNVNASDEEETVVDGSRLTTDDSSTGYSTSKSRKYLMDGVSTISKAGRNRVYAYASTTTNEPVEYMATIVYVEKYNKVGEEEYWDQVTWWMEESENDFYMSTADSVTVEQGHYYRVRSNHIIRTTDEETGETVYEETYSYTDGILVPET